MVVVWKGECGESGRKTEIRHTKKTVGVIFLVRPIGKRALAALFPNFRNFTHDFSAGHEWAICRETNVLMQREIDKDSRSMSEANVEGYPSAILISSLIMFQWHVIL